jgi:hypothetical protein
MEAAMRKNPLKLIALAGLVTVTACAGDPTIQTGEDAEVIMGGLNRVDNARVKMAYVDPDADYARYARVLIAPLDLDNVEIIQSSNSSTMGNRYNREWELEDRDKEALQKAFRESMEQQLTDEGDFALATAGGDDVITISAMITAIRPNAPKDDFSSRGTGRSRVYSQGGGDISITVSFADGDSGEVLALIKDTRSDTSNVWGVNNSVTNMAGVRRVFNGWARQIHDGLVALKTREMAKP